jgi:serine/threonine protein phosphatase 1
MTSARPTEPDAAAAPDAPPSPLHLHADRKDLSLVYAIGDVHGMADLLDALIACIEADAQEAGRPATLVFLGDLINRGPGSRRVIERIMAGPRRPGDRWITLRGNHEQALLDGLQDSAAFQRFLAKGGVQTLRSYGLVGSRMSLESARAALPREHVDFLAHLPLTYRRGGWLFVHAGVEPGTPVEEQTPEKLMTIRKRFQSGAAQLPFTVVHGHVPSRGKPVVAPGRIGVDTGAVTTGVLTAVALEKKRKPRFLRVEAHRGKRVKS